MAETNFNSKYTGNGKSKSQLHEWVDKTYEKYELETFWSHISINDLPPVNGYRMREAGDDLFVVLCFHRKCDKGVTSGG